MKDEFPCVFFFLTLDCWIHQLFLANVINWVHLPYRHNDNGLRKMLSHSPPTSEDGFSLMTLPLLPLTARSAVNGTFLIPVFIHTVYSQLSFCWQTQVTIYNLYNVTMLNGNLHSKPITVLFLYIWLCVATVEMKAAVFIVSGLQGVPFGQ